MRHADHIVVSSAAEGASWITLKRAQARNALDWEMLDALNDAITEVESDLSTSVALIRSSLERVFVAGGDIAVMRDLDIDSGARFVYAGHRLMRRLEESRIVFIAVVNGFALGGGFELALSCDLIVADSTAVFGLTEVTVGLVPGGGGTQLLARRIGAGRAADLVLTGRKVDAQEAFRLGIVDRLAVGVHVRQLALDVAATIEANSPLAVRYAKHALRFGYGTALHEGLEIEDAAWRAAALSADRREGISAFTEKRAPRWSGK